MKAFRFSCCRLSAAIATLQEWSCAPDHSTGWDGDLCRLRHRHARCAILFEQPRSSRLRRCVSRKRILPPAIFVRHFGPPEAITGGSQQQGREKQENDCDENMGPFHYFLHKLANWLNS